MSVVDSDIVLYASQDMPVNDTDTSGGAINSGIRVVFTDIIATDVVEGSGTESDSGTLTITGRNTAGSVVTDNITLLGTTLVSGTQAFERILIVQNDEAASGEIVLRDHLTNSGIGSIYANESGFRRPFYDATAAAPGGSDKELYEKIYLMNLNTVNALLGATITEVVTGVYTKVAFATEDTLASTQSVANRVAVPTGTGPYGSGASGVPGTDLQPLGYLGVWLQLDLNAGDAAQNSFYQLQIDGSTT